MQGVDEPLEPQTWYTVDEAARYLRLPREVIYMLIQQGHLIAYKVAGRGNERFARRDLDAMMRIVETSGDIATVDRPKIGRRIGSVSGGDMVGILDALKQIFRMAD